MIYENFKLIEAKVKAIRAHEDQLRRIGDAPCIRLDYEMTINTDLTGDEPYRTMGLKFVEKIRAEIQGNIDELKHDLTAL